MDSKKRLFIFDYIYTKHANCNSSYIKSYYIFANSRKLAEDDLKNMEKSEKILILKTIGIDQYMLPDIYNFIDPIIKEHNSHNTFNNEVYYE